MFRVVVDKLFPATHTGITYPSHKTADLFGFRKDFGG